MNQRIFVRLILCFFLSFYCLTGMMPEKAEAATTAEINASTASGIQWLAAQQNPDGSWGSAHYSGTTGFSVAVLIHYAENLGVDPLSPAYMYQSNVQAGLDYIFSAAFRDTVNQRVWWQHGGSYSNYESGPPLMAICRTSSPNTVVNVSGSPVDGMTYLQVAQETVNYLVYTQGITGNYVGAWGYHGPDSGSDQSTTGWVVLGLGYAEHSFNISIPAGLLTALNTYIDYIQYTPADTSDPMHGGSGYWQANQWINCYKTGHLLYEMELVGDTTATPRVQWALDFLGRHWNVPNSGYSGHTSTVNGFPDVGWRGNPPSPLPSYIATATIMKAMLSLGLDTIGAHDWYDDFTDVIVANQHVDGYWEQGGYPTGYRTLSTNWALLTMLKASSAPPPPPASIPTLSEWGMIILFLLTITAGFMVIRRRRV